MDSITPTGKASKMHDDNPKENMLSEMIEDVES